MSVTFKPLFSEIISALLIILFVYASVSKINAFDEFKLQLSKSPFITQFSTTLAWSLPVIEIAVSVLLVFPALRLLGFYMSLFLLSMFTSYLIAMLNFSYYIPCSCGGVLSMLSWKQHVIFNLIFLVLATIGILLNDFGQKNFTSLNPSNKVKNYLQIKE